MFSRRSFFGLLTLLFLLPNAFAQTERPRSVAVLDFTVPRDRNAFILSRQATDAFASELQRVGTYETVPRAQVERAIRDLELTSPLNRSQLTRLGESLSADYIAIGALRTVSKVAKPAHYRANLFVLLFDVATGEYGSGANATGTANIPEGATLSDGLTDRFALQAVSDAAFNAVRTITRFQLPEATVLITSSDSVVLNGGVRNGIKVGQEFIILRRGQQVGRVRVVSVSSQDARASIIEDSRGIRPEDKARAIVRPEDL